MPNNSPQPSNGTKDNSIKALLDVLMGAPQQPESDDDTDEERRERDERNRELGAIQSEAARLGLVLHHGVDAEMGKSLVIRKQFADQHAADTMKPGEVAAQQRSFARLQGFGVGVVQSCVDGIKPGTADEQVRKSMESARKAFDAEAHKSKLEQGGDLIEVAYSAFDAALDAVVDVNR